MNQTQDFFIEGTCLLPSKAIESPEFLFQHLVLSISSAIDESELEKLADIHRVDFISQVEEGTINFIHVSYPSQLKSIKERGLIASSESSDLGVGVYLIEEDDVEGTENLLTYVETLMQEEILIIKGTYQGEYMRCIYGESHEGYIVVKETVLPNNIEDWSKKTQEDIWFSGFDI